MTDRKREEKVESQASVNKISQGRQGDPKETNVLPNPVIEQFPLGGDSDIKVKVVKQQVGGRKSSAKKEPPGKEERKTVTEGYGVNAVEVYGGHAEKTKEQIVLAAAAASKSRSKVEGLPRGPTPPTRSVKGPPATDSSNKKLPPPKKRPTGKRGEVSLEEEQSARAIRASNNPIHL